MKHKKSKNNLDEMQDHKLLKIEEFGFWLVFWALAAAVVIQALIGANIEKLIGEIVVLFIASIYIAYSTLKNGLWTRNIIPSLKGNAITSIIPSLGIGVFNAVRVFVILDRQISLSAVLQIVIVMVVVYALCFVILEVFRMIYKMKRRKLDNIIDEEER